MDVVVIGDTAKDINIFKGRTQKEIYDKDTKVLRDIFLNKIFKF